MDMLYQGWNFDWFLFNEAKNKVEEKNGGFLFKTSELTI